VQPMCIDTLILLIIMFLSIVILIPICLWLIYIWIKRCRNIDATYVVNGRMVSWWKRRIYKTLIILSFFFIFRSHSFFYIIYWDWIKYHVEQLIMFSYFIASTGYKMWIRTMHTLYITELNAIVLLPVKNVYMMSDSVCVTFSYVRVDIAFYPVEIISWFTQIQSK
jgi:hypothetical protein